MDLPTPENTNAKHSTLEQAEEFFQSEKYVDDLKILAAAKNHIDKVFSQEEGLDYMISEIKRYFIDGKFSDHCYEYAEKGNPPLTEAQISELLPKNDEGKPIWSYKDV